jgi:hypothetical protein
LVAELPPDDIEYPELVTIYQSHELSEIIIAKSILGNAGIAFVAKGEMPKELLAVGPVELQVDRSDAEQARGLLIDLEADRAPDDFLEPPSTEDEGEER